METPGFKGCLQYVDSCPNQPLHSKAFCEEHCKTAESKGVPTTLKEFISYKSNMVCGLHMYSASFPVNFSSYMKQNFDKGDKTDVEESTKHSSAAECQGTVHMHVQYKTIVSMILTLFI